MHPEVENLDQLPKAKHISQIAVFLGSLVGIFFAFHMTDILDAMIIFNYPYMGSLLIPLLGGLLWKGATRRGAFAAAVARRYCRRRRVFYRYSGTAQRPD